MEKINFKKTVIGIIVLCMISNSCKQNKNHDDLNGEILKNQYSKTFSIAKTIDGYDLKIKNRFDNTDFQTYHLTKDKKIAGITIPVKKIICLSTTHCAFISELNEISTIKGISGTKYIFNDKILEKIIKNEIIDVGYDAQINYEKIISIKPDVIFAYAVDNNSISVYQKLEKIGIPIIYINDFIETTPLGRSEWIKFFACFFDKFDFAQNYFDSICNNYNLVIEKINKNNKNKPKILLNLPYKGIWWVPGGKSYFANFIKDAGGNYIFSNNNSEESIPYTMEDIFKKAEDAEIWLNPNEFFKKDEIINFDKRLRLFKPINLKKIYNNNKRMGKNGGNDFWESGIIKPDKILKDLYLIFFTEDINADSLYFYKKIE